MKTLKLILLCTVLMGVAASGQVSPKLIVQPKALPIVGGSKVAVKCDMCKDIKEGPVCVRACPVGAALRVNPEELLNYAGGSNTDSVTNEVFLTESDGN